MLEGVLHEAVALLGREILNLVGDAGEEDVADGAALGLDVVGRGRGRAGAGRGGGGGGQGAGGGGAGGVAVGLVLGFGFGFGVGFLGGDAGVVRGWDAWACAAVGESGVRGVVGSVAEVRRS